MCGWTRRIGRSDIVSSSVVEVLLKAGADVNARNQYGDTALITACCQADRG